eukprot:751524-Hanusia_phi.AAC.2
MRASDTFKGRATEDTASEAEMEEREECDARQIPEPQSLGPRLRRTTVRRSDSEKRDEGEDEKREETA